jgi:hypothetical protein
MLIESHASSSQLYAHRPFSSYFRLVGHFLARLARSGNDAASTELELGVGGLLGLLAAPGAFSCLLLLDKYSTFLNWMRGRLHTDLYVASLPDKYLFLSIAMAVTGIVTVLKWDKILPDAQDYLNLAPLPIRPRAILLANAAALAIAVLVFAVDVNGVSAVFFPLFVTAAAQTDFVAFLDFVAVHAACMLLASVFTFCAVFALLGTLAALLPREAFRAISCWVRGIVLVGFIALLLTGFAGPEAVKHLPSFWFLGLYQTWQHRATPEMTQAANTALAGVAAAFLLMVASYSLSYRRRYAAVLEGGRPPSKQPLVGLLPRFLDLFASRAASFPRACHGFVVRALLRNETHRLAIAVSLGLGWLLALEEVSQGRPEQAPLVAAYLLILGLRLAFEFPAGVPANWVFRTVLDPRANESLGVARLVMLSFLTPFVLLPCLALTWWHSGFVVAALHTAYVLALSLCFMEILLAGYRKVPLACPMPGFRDNLLMLCLMQFLGFEVFTRMGAGMERWMFGQPVLFLLVPGLMVLAWLWHRMRLRDALEAGELEEGLTFENLRTPVVERLKLDEG